jgi:hypothetical protein
MSVMVDNGDSPSGQLSAAVELVPDEVAVVFFAMEPQDLPDPDVIGELRMWAYDGRNDRDLGAEQWLPDVFNVAQIVGEGMASSAAWGGLVATARFFARRRAHTRAAVQSEQKAAAQAEAAATAADLHAGSPLTMTSCDDQGDAGWRIVFEIATGDRLTISLDPACTVAGVHRADKEPT